MKQIWCDIDSTINNHWRRIRRNTVPQWPNGIIDKKAFTEAEVMRDVPLQNALVITTYLQQEGFELSFLSARGWANARRITTGWLKKWGFEYKNLYLVAQAEAKIPLLEMHRPDIYIDDFTSGQEKSIPTFQYELAKQIETFGTHVIVFRNDWWDVLQQIKEYYRESLSDIGTP